METNITPEMEKLINLMIDKAESEEGQKAADELLELFRARKAGDLVLDLELEDITKILNMDYLAERFFEKPGLWLTDKINNEKTNHKAQGLTKVERVRLKDGLDTLAWELQELSDNL